jgi:iron(III) transport system substrate-binding protein
MRALFLSLLLAAIACTTGPKAPDPVVIYCGRGEALVDDLLARASAETGVPIQIQYGSTPDLVTRILTERELTQADLVFAQEAGHLRALADKGLLEPLPAALLEQVEPRFRDGDGRWVGTSGRLRTLVVHGPSVPPEERPTALEQLAEPRFADKLAWAPSNASFQAHVAALLHVWGPERTRAWLTAVQANRPRVFPKNAPIVRAASEGEIAIGWVNHYYLHQAARPGERALNHSTGPGDAGNVLMVAGLAVRAGSPRREGAHKLVGWLLSEPAQREVAQTSWEYPVRPGVATHADVPPLDRIGVVDVPQDKLADLEPARAVLRELGLL